MTSRQYESGGNPFRGNPYRAVDGVQQIGFLEVLRFAIRDREPHHYTLTEPPEWTLASSCIESKAHQDALEHLGKNVAMKAKAECFGCGVREQCLELALRVEADSPARMRHGIFGGMTPGERFALFEQGGTQPHDTAVLSRSAPPEALSA